MIPAILGALSLPVVLLILLLFGGASFIMLLTAKFWLLVGLFAVMYIIAQRGLIRKQDVPKVMVLMLLGVFVISIMPTNFFSVAVKTPVKATAYLSAPKGTSPLMSFVVAPRTFREVKLKLENNDPELPLVVRGARVVAVVGCDKKDVMTADARKLCEAKPGDSLRMGGLWNGIVDFANKVFNKYHVGISGEKPTTWGWSKLRIAKRLDKEVVLSKSFGEEIALWDPQVCEQNAIEGTDCSKFVKSVCFGELPNCDKVITKKPLGYVWADEDAEAGSTHKIKIVVLDKAGGITNSWLITWLAGTKYNVIATSEEEFVVQYPNITLFLVIGAIGIMLALWWFTKGGV